VAIPILAKLSNKAKGRLSPVRHPVGPASGLYDIAAPGNKID